MRVCRYWLCLSILSLIGTFPTLMRAQGASSESQPITSVDQSAVTIGPGDLIDISVYDVPELLLKVRVDASGFVSLPLIGDIKLGGLTVREAQLAIARELVRRQLVMKPEVSIFIEEFATKGITVYGEVNSPGIYPLMGPHTLYDAISAAGGLTMNAGRTVTVLHSHGKGGEEVIDLAADRTLQQKNVPIAPGDTVIVSKAGVVYVLGEVAKPGAFLMANNTSISLLKAIALAGSTTKFSSLKHVFIIRKSTGGTEQLEVSLDKIYHGRESDMPLKAEDIVFVPFSNWKLYGPMGIQGAIQAAVLSVYILPQVLP